MTLNIDTSMCCYPVYDLETTVSYFKSMIIYLLQHVLLINWAHLQIQVACVSLTYTTLAVLFNCTHPKPVEIDYSMNSIL